MVHMTYWGYHLIFTLPLIGILFWFIRRDFSKTHWVCLGITLAIVYAFTIPWDNYAASGATSPDQLGIWGFGENVSLGYPFRDLAEKTPFLGHIPLEEYAYFGIQAILAVFATMLFLRSPKSLRSKTGEDVEKKEN